jgi:acetoin utilization protein AcuB
MNVKDLMTAAPATIRGEETCNEAAIRMRDHKIHHLPVVDRRGLLEGMLTDRDLRHYLLSPTVMHGLGRMPAARLLEKTRVVDVMSAPAIVTTPDEKLEVAVARMREHRLGALPVVEGRKLVGIITETDLLESIVDADDAAELHVTGVLLAYP